MRAAVALTLTVLPDSGSDCVNSCLASRPEAVATSLSTARILPWARRLILGSGSRKCLMRVSISSWTSNREARSAASTPGVPKKEPTTSSGPTLSSGWNSGGKSLITVS